MSSAAPARRGPEGAGALLRPGFVLARGMRVGLLGGSFDPPHAGHLHVAETARERLGLDRVIWLVAPQNPLKARKAASLERRLEAVRALARGPGHLVTDLEARIGTRFTIETLRALQRRHPGVRFVWLMGADNLAGFHRWKGWTEIAKRVPIAVVARPGVPVSARFGRFAQRFRSARRPAEDARGLAGTPAPAWTWLTAPLNPLSSTALRAGAEARASALTPTRGAAERE